MLASYKRKSVSHKISSSYVHNGKMEVSYSACVLGFYFSERKFIDKIDV